MFNALVMSQDDEGTASPEVKSLELSDLPEALASAYADRGCCVRSDIHAPVHAEVLGHRDKAEAL